MPLPILVKAALVTGIAMTFPTLMRKMHREAAKHLKIYGEDYAKAVKRIESSDKIKEAIAEAAREARKHSQKLFEVPFFGDVRVADLPLIGDIERRERWDKTYETVRKTFKKHGIKADHVLLTAATNEVQLGESAGAWASFVAEVGAAGMATSRVSQAAKHLAKKGIINLADKKIRKELVKHIAKEAAIAGAVEGAANAVISLTSQQDISMHKDKRVDLLLGSIMQGAAIGALVSGVAGAGLGWALTSPALISGSRGLKGAAKKAIRTAIDWSQELIDVQEKFGDILADKLFSPSPIRVAVVTPSSSISTTTSTTQSSGKRKTGGGKGRSYVPSTLRVADTPRPDSSIIISPINSTTSTTSTTSSTTSTTNTTNTTTGTTSTTISTTSTTSTTTPSHTPPNSTTSTNTTDDTFTNTGDNTPSDSPDTTPDTTPEPTPDTTPEPTPNDTPTLDTTPTPTPTPTPIPTPSVTPSPEYLPMPLVPMPYKEAPVIYGRTMKSIYVNELERLKRMLRDMINW